MEIQNKKIPITIILISVLSLPLSFLIKAPYDYALIAYYSENQISIPLSEYYVIWDWLSLERATIILFLSLAIGIYCYLYKTDENIKLLLKHPSIIDNALFKFCRTIPLKILDFYKAGPSKSKIKSDILQNDNNYKEKIELRKNEVMGNSIILENKIKPLSFMGKITTIGSYVTTYAFILIVLTATSVLTFGLGILLAIIIFRFFKKLGNQNISLYKTYTDYRKGETTAIKLQGLWNKSHEWTLIQLGTFVLLFLVIICINGAFTGGLIAVIFLATLIILSVIHYSFLSIIKTQLNHNS